jgi:hypothetical protein
MAKFDPDAYLASQNFDPDAYLGKKQTKPSFGEMLKQEVMGSLPVQGTLGAIRGAANIGATLLKPVDVAAEYLSEKTGVGGFKQFDRRAAVEEGLKSLGANPESLGYQGGKLATEIAGTAGAPGILAKGAQALRAAPAIVNALRGGGLVSPGIQGGRGATLANAGLRLLSGTATGATAAGLINPEDADTGAIFGAALPVAQRAISLIRPNVNDSLVKKALEAKAPFGIADLSENAMVKGIRSFLADLPIIGRPANAAAKAKQEWFNRQVGKSFGAEFDKLTPDVMDDASKRLGAEFNRLWGNNKLVLDSNLADDIAKIQQEAAENLDPEQITKIDKIIGNLLRRQENGAIPGNFANNWQSRLRIVAEGEKGFHQKLLSDLRKSVLSAFGRGLTPEDAAALTMNKQQYRAFKTVEPLLAKGEVGVAGREMGDVPASLLPNAVFQQYGRGASNTPLGEAAQMGSRFVADRVAQTGGSPRAFVQNALGSALGVGSYFEPTILATAPIAYGVSSTLNNPTLARILASQASPQNQALINALRQSLPTAVPVLSTQ